MEFRELKAFAANLGRFASVRENAAEPSDRMVIQCFEGILKFVAGCDYDTRAKASIVASSEAKTTGMAVVAARTFLQAAKLLKGKGQVDFDIDPEGCTMRTSLGGEISLPNISREVPSFVRQPDQTHGLAAIPKGFLPKASSLLSATTSMAYGPWTQVAVSHDGDKLRLQGGDPYMHTMLSLEGASVVGPVGAVHPSFFESIKGFEDEGLLMWDEATVMVTQGPYAAFTTLMERYPPNPEMPEMTGLDTRLEVNRKELLDAIKTIGGEKVSFGPVKDGIVVASWPDGKTRLKLAANLTGKGRMAVMTDRISKLSAAIGGDSVVLEWASEKTGPLRMEGDHGWCLLSRVPLT